MVYAIDSKSEPRGTAELGLDDNPLSIAIALPNEKYVEYVQPALRAESLVHLEQSIWGI